MEQQFVGHDPTKTSAVQRSAQLFSTSYDNSPRAILYPAGETTMQLSSYSVFGSRNVYFLVIQTISNTFSLVLRKGKSYSSQTGLIVLDYNNGEYSVVFGKSYINNVEVHKNGNELCLFVHFTPSLYYPNAPEYYYLETTASGSILKEASFVDGYYSNFVDGMKNKSLYRNLERIKDTCDAGNLEISSMFDWAAFYRANDYIVWENWGQRNITFSYMSNTYPYIRFKNLL